MEGQLYSAMLYKGLEHLRNLIHVRIKNPSANAGDSGDMGSISGSRRYPGGENENLPQHSCLDNPTDKGACQVEIYGIAKSQTQLSKYASTRILE